MTSRSDATGAFTQLSNVENRLISVTKRGVGTTTFGYDAAGQRVKTVKPDGTIIYTPYPNYEEEIRPATAAARSPSAARAATLAARPTSSTLSTRPSVAMGQ